MENKCKGQTQKHKEKRQEVKAAMLNALKNTNASLSTAAADAAIEKQLNKIYQLKKKLFEKNGLSEIDPADNGLWHGDMILNNEQVDYLLKRLDNPKPLAKKPADKHRPKRSAATYFEDWPSSRWTMPIRYWLSSAYTSTEKSAIDAALNQIYTSTGGCIRFVKDTTRLTSGSQMQFWKPGTGCYGYSYIGRQSGGITNINVATGGCSGDVFKGLVMHETIHALGGGHEQCRTDRDDYIEILWENIDPQDWDQYEIDDWSTSYGVPYDYKSRMHYHQGAMAVEDGLDTMVPYVDTVLGGNYLTSNDILQLKRMYCKPSTCVDRDQECGTWAIEGWCRDVDWAAWMKQNCARSCGAC